MALRTFVALLPAALAGEGGSTDFVSQYAGDYQKYMSGGGGGDYSKYYQKYMGSSGGGGGDYMHFMNDYAGKYASQYMSSATSQKSDKEVANLVASEKGDDKPAKADTAQAGDYQQYMSKYSGDYQKYMGGGGSQGGAQGGDYQKYMKQYSGDYQKYMGGAGSQGGAQGGDYQKYMQGNTAGNAVVLLAETKDKEEAKQKLAEDRQHMKDKGAAASKDFEKYMTGQAAQFKHYVKLQSADAAGDLQKYFEDYTQYMKSEGRDAADGMKGFMDKYAKDYEHFLKERGSSDKHSSPAVMLEASALQQELADEKKLLAQEMKVEQQQQAEEMKTEKDRMAKEKLALKKELAREAAKNQSQASQASQASQPVMLLERSNLQFGTVFFAAFGTVVAVLAFVRRSRTAHSEDYVMHLEAPLAPLSTV